MNIGVDGLCVIVSSWIDNESVISVYISRRGLDKSDRAVAVLYLALSTAWYPEPNPQVGALR